jgi:3-deoxy-D-manno-octulosonate 8-phosphate phosphatase (KDO 8-P phosphatase)
LNFNKIKAVIFDFDGVFTDNRVIVSEDGKESVQCNRADGIGLGMLRKLNIPMTIISTEKNPVVSMRAKKLELSVSYGIANKLKELMQFSDLENVDLDDIAFVGNDINDLDCMRKVGYPVAVFDAVDEIKLIAKHSLSRNGGDGAVREICELIYKSYQND